MPRMQAERDNRKEIGKRIVAAREERGYNQRELSDMTGDCSSSGYLSHVESGNYSNLPYKYIESICKVLNIRKEWLLYGDGVMDNQNERIIEVRKDYGLSVYDFYYTRAKIKPTLFWDIEMGQVLPSDKEIQLICDTFSVNPEWIKNNTGKKYTEYHYVADRIKRHKEYSDAIASINDADRSLIAAKLLDLLEAFISNNKKNEESGD